VRNLVGGLKELLEMSCLLDSEFGELWIDVVPIRIAFTPQFVVFGLLVN
jgi:hypothetical protein